MTERRRNSGGLYEWANTCDQCLKPRSTGKHAKCSKLRQAANQRLTQEVAPANPAIRRIYISGPMTGLPDFNYPAFNAEAARLRALGYHVENPAENPPQDSWEAYMEVCIPQLLTCDTIALLPGWSESRGALRERQVASQNGMTITAAARICARSAYHGKSDHPSTEGRSTGQGSGTAERSSSVCRPVQQRARYGSEQRDASVHSPVPAGG